MAKMRVEVEVKRSKEGGYVAQACVRARKGFRYDRHVATKGGRCSSSQFRKTPTKAARAAIQSLGRRLK